MSEAQFNQYNNVVTFAKDWRKYKLLTKPLDMNSFRKFMQADQYVTLECLDQKKGKSVLIYLFDKDSKYTVASQDLKKLLNKNKNPGIIILITYKPLGTYCKRAVNSFKHLSIYVYRQEIFGMITPNGPLCYPHRVMSREEVLKLTNDDLACYLTNLPKIFDEDTQCIWIGAEVGDVVEIKMLSDISGETIQYRVVIPKSGRIIGYKDLSDENKEAVDVDRNADIEEEDDEVQEHRENKEINEDDIDDEEDNPRNDHDENDDD
jgi:hypothetical protein